MDEESPLRLEQLADVESPDVMRAALARFRRRTLARGIGFVLLFLALPFLLRGVFEEEISNADALARAERVQIGTIMEGDASTLLILDARKVREEELGRLVPPSYGGGRLLHVVATTDALRRGEFLEVSIDSPFVSGGGPDPPPWPPVRAQEVLLDFGPGQEEMTVYLVAVKNVDGPARGPGSFPQRACAVPLNTAGVCELLKSEGRVIDTYTIRFADLDIPRSIWGVRDVVPAGEPTGPPPGPARNI